MFHATWPPCPQGDMRMKTAPTACQTTASFTALAAQRPRRRFKPASMVGGRPGGALFFNAHVVIRSKQRTNNKDLLLRRGCPLCVLTFDPTRPLAARLSSLADHMAAAGPPRQANDWAILRQTTQEGPALTEDELLMASGAYRQEKYNEYQRQVRGAKAERLGTHERKRCISCDRPVVMIISCWHDFFFNYFAVV